MKVTKKDEYKVPVFSWCENIEESAMEQIDHLAQLPFVHKRVCIMPDCHAGYGMPIGGVCALDNVICPSMVGVDIGCGMCAVKTSLTDLDTETLKNIMGKIREVIPVGFGHQKTEQDDSLMPKEVGNFKQHFSQEGMQEFALQAYTDEYPVVTRQYHSALKQLGTLGGGNHFIEIQKGSDGHIWIMIHSGSRNLGKQVADYYNKKAIELNEKWHSSVPKEWELAFLTVDSYEGQQYLKEMQYCVDFALANRKLMMERICKVFWDNETIAMMDEQIEFDEMINIAHNYASLENHFGKNLWVHRKGATLAREGTIGIIPGSMGTSSYIVRGLGNAESFMSCSHGAGRKMGRKEAQRTLVLEEEQEKMKDILGAPRSQDDLEEAPGAYKDIADVMEQQKDLVEILVELKPLGVIKG